MEYIKTPFYENENDFVNYLKSLPLKEDKKYLFILPIEETKYSIIEDILFYIDDKYLTFNIFDNGCYLPNENNTYYALVKIVKEATKLIVNKDTKLIYKKVAFEHETLKELIIEAEECVIKEGSFKFIENLNCVTFKNSKNIFIKYDAFSYSNIKEIQFDPKGHYELHSASFACIRDTIFALPVDAVIEDGAFKNSSPKIVFVPKEITDISNYNFSKYTIFYLEGDGSKVLFKKEETIHYTEYSGVGYHQHSDEEVHYPNEYCTFENCHSFKTYKDFLNKKKELLEE